MTAKEFFRGIREDQRVIRAIQRRRERYLEMATYVGGLGDVAVHGGERKSRVEEAAISLADLAEELGDAARAYVDRARMAERILQEMTPRYQEILTRRYILCEPWEAIGAAMQYQGGKSVYRAHGWALQEAQKIMDRIPKDTK